MLPEKSMKTTTAVACRTAAGTDGVQPVVRSRTGVVRARSQSISPRRDSTTILRLVLAVHRDLRPQLQCREFGVLPEGERWQESTRSEEHTSELQSPCNLVCRLLLEKKKISNDS